MPIDMVKNALSKQTGAKGIILEGYPRTMAQVQDYDKYVSENITEILYKMDHQVLFYVLTFKMNLGLTVYLSTEKPLWSKRLLSEYSMV